MTQEELITLGARMNAQNNRSTAFPIFVVQEEKKVYGDPDYGFDEKERVEDVDGDLLCDHCADLEEMPEECRTGECSPRAFQYYRKEWVISERAGFFFTAEACDRHIEMNHHHYGKNARSYAQSGYHNEHLRKILQHISALGSEDGKPGSAYR